MTLSICKVGCGMSLNHQASSLVVLLVRIHYVIANDTLIRALSLFSLNNEMESVLLTTGYFSWIEKEENSMLGLFYSWVDTKQFTYRLRHFQSWDIGS